MVLLFHPRKSVKLVQVAPLCNCMLRILIVLPEPNSQFLVEAMGRSWMFRAESSIPRIVVIGFLNSPLISISVFLNGIYIVVDPELSHTPSMVSHVASQSFGTLQIWRDKSWPSTFLIKRGGVSKHCIFSRRWRRRRRTVRLGLQLPIPG